MKKSKFLALALAGAITLTGAGYAYWTDTLTVNNTVATGEFDVQFSKIVGDEESPTVLGLERNTPGYDQDKDLSGQTWYASDYVGKEDNFGKFLEANLSENNKDMNVKISNLYPGSKGKLKTIVENTGTIPVVFDYAEVIPKEGSEALLDKVLFSVGKYEDEDPTDRHAKVQGLTIATLEQGINDFLANERLEPKSVGTTVLDDGFVLDPSIMPLKLNVVLSPAVEEEAENLTGSFTVRLHWKQHNAPSTVKVAE